jgi:FHA domain
MSANFKKITIGRDSKNQVVLSDSSVSRMHAELFIDNEGNAFLTDMNSSNGTTVNGSRISGTVQLKKNDVVMFGTVKYAWENEIAPKGRPQGDPQGGYMPPPSKLPPPPPVSGSSNQKMMFWVLGALIVLLTAAGILFFLNQEEDNEDRAEDIKRTGCITMNDIFEDKGEKGDCCDGCEEGQEIPTKKGRTVHIKNGKISKIEEKEEPVPPVAPPVDDNGPKVGGTGKPTPKDKKPDGPPAHGYLSKKNTVWVAGQDDKGLDAMRNNINQAAHKNWTSEQIRQANKGTIEDKPNPTIVPGQSYNLPKEKK